MDGEKELPQEQPGDYDDEELNLDVEQERNVGTDPDLSKA